MVLLSAQIIEKFRRGSDTSDQQMIPRSGAGNIQEMAFCVVDRFEVGIVSYGFDALLKRYDLVITRHHNDSSKLKPFGQMHGTDGDVVCCGFHIVA